MMMYEALPSLRSAILEMKVPPIALIVEMFETQAFAIAEVRIHHFKCMVSCPYCNAPTLIRKWKTITLTTKNHFPFLGANRFALLTLLSRFCDETIKSTMSICAWEPRYPRLMGEHVP